jgi:hypothetical protein
VDRRQHAQDLRLLRSGKVRLLHLVQDQQVHVVVRKGDAVQAPLLDIEPAAQEPGRRSLLPQLGHVLRILVHGQDQQLALPGQRQGQLAITAIGNARHSALEGGSLEQCLRPLGRSIGGIRRTGAAEKQHCGQ